MLSFDRVDAVLIVESPLPTRRILDPDFLATGRAACGKSSSSKRFPPAAQKHDSGILKGDVTNSRLRERKERILKAKAGLKKSQCRKARGPRSKRPELAGCNSAPTEIRFARGIEAMTEAQHSRSLDLL